MKRLTSICVLVGLIAVILAAAGCGNGEKNDYVDQVNAIQTDLQTQASETLAGGAPSTGPQAAEFADKLQALFASAADDLEAVDPPEEVADLHAQLVAKVREIGDEIGKAGEAFSSGNAAQIQQAAADLQSAVGTAQPELSSLIDQINTELQG
jgi:hypothetical protein